MYSLRTKLTKPHIFLKCIFKNIKTNAFSINIQFILDPYVATTYCTSYMTKLNKTITSELLSIIKKCIAHNIDANTKIQKLSNDFLNAQQMVVQFVVYIMFSLPLYHSSPFEECAFIALNELEPNLSDILSSSIIEKILIILVNMNHCH
jgi:hypothetical protein